MPIWDVVVSMDRVIEALGAALEVRDLSTHDHSNRVVTLASRLGSACGLEPRQVHLLEYCARFHDIGKIGIPDSVLHKTGKLGHDEYDVIKQHSGIGAALIRRINIPGIDAFAQIVEHHHERFDGKGYPAGLSGTNIPLLSRIITVADSFDAITSKRSYRDARPTEMALETIAAGSGKQFDPELAGLFINIVESGAANA